MLWDEHFLWHQYYPVARTTSTSSVFIYQGLYQKAFIPRHLKIIQNFIKFCTTRYLTLRLSNEDTTRVIAFKWQRTWSSSSFDVIPVDARWATQGFRCDYPCPQTQDDCKVRKDAHRHYRFRGNPGWTWVSLCLSPAEFSNFAIVLPQTPGSFDSLCWVDMKPHPLSF